MEDAQWAGFLLTGIIALVSAAAGWWWGQRNAAAERAASAAQFREEQGRTERFAAEAARLPDAVQRAERAEQATAQTKALLDAQSQASATALATLAALRDAEAASSIELQSSRDAVNGARAQIEQLNVALATASAQRDAARLASEEAKAFLIDAREKLRVAFTDAASQVFDAKARTLHDQIKASGVEAKQGLAETLKPFAERVESLQTKIETLTGTEAQERATLVGTIAELKTLNQEMADATNALSKALKGGSKVRGQWGEMILETVLKASGLVEGMNFESQRKTTDEDSGQRRFADVVVTLPDGRAIVIDSKVNLIAWAEANDAETPEAHHEAMTRHAAALRMHMRDLGEKNYPKTLGPHALDITVLFVPIEGALSSALSHNKDLQVEAFEKRVVFASPNTLMAMLQVCARLWRHDKLQKQLHTISVEAGRLIDSVGALLEEFDDIGRHIGKSEAAFRQARHRLTDSPQSVLARARRLVEAGAKGKKAIPEEMQPAPGGELLSLEDGSEPGAS